MDTPVVPIHGRGAVPVVCRGGGHGQVDQPEGGTTEVAQEHPRALFNCGRRGEVIGRELSPRAAHGRHAKTGSELHAVEDKLGNIKGKADQGIKTRTVVLLLLLQLHPNKNFT